MLKSFVTATFLICFIVQINCIDVKISIKDDSRVNYLLDTNFNNYYKHTELYLSISNFRIEHGKESNVMGFSIIKEDDNPDVAFNETSECFLEEKNLIESNKSMVFMIMDFKNNQVQINCSKLWTNYRIFEDPSMDESFQGTETFVKPIKMIKTKSDDKYSYYSFKMYLIASEEAIYGIFFHNCNGDKLSYDVLYTSQHHNDYLEALFKSFPHATWSIVALCFFMLGLYWIYVFRTSQHALQNFHYILTAIVFLLALFNVLYTFKLYIIDSPGDRKSNWITFMSLFYLTRFAILCCTLMLMFQGWNFVKSIFGRKERRFLMVVLSFQILMWSIQYCEEPFPNYGYSLYFDLMHFFELISAVVMIFYLFIRKADARSHKALENLKKFQLFRSVYIMIVFFFYFVSLFIGILRFNYIVPGIKYFVQIYEDVFRFVFLAIIGYKFQPKFISDILALGNEGEVLPITDINKDNLILKDEQ